jgi:hypothetical protein
MLAREGLILICRSITRPSSNKQAELMPHNYRLLAALSVYIFVIKPAHISAKGLYT